MYLPVGKNQSVDTKILIAGNLRWPVIASIRPEFFALFVCFKQALVNPIPDEASLQLFVFIKKIPVILEIADAVSHSMGILTHNKRTIFESFSQVFFKMLDRAIHRADDVCVRACQGAFVLNWSRGITFFNPLVSSAEVYTVARFIPQGPDDDARMILIPFNHADCPVQVSIFPFRIITQRSIWIIPHAVRLDICLIHHIQPVFITKLVPARDVRIMACPDRVYVESFHYLDILDHVFF